MPDPSPTITAQDFLQTLLLDAERRLQAPGAAPGRAEYPGLRLPAAQLQQARFAGAALPDADLAGADLSRADLSNVVMRAGRLPQARLEGANLASADLSGTDFTGVEASEADFSGALLEDARLRSAKLRFALFSGALLEGANLDHADLWAAKLDGAEAVDATFRSAVMHEANLAEADLTGADLTRAEMKKINLRNAILQRADLRDADLRGADLAGADLRGASLPRVDLSSCVLDGVRLSGAWLDNTRFTIAQLGPGLGEELAGEFPDARRGYLALEQNFRGQGDPEAARWCYLRARRMGKRAAWAALCQATRQRNWRTLPLSFGAWAGEAFAEWLCGYGESLPRVLRAFLVTTASFALFYGLTDSLLHTAESGSGQPGLPVHNIFQLLGFSFLNMCTSGIPDIGLKPGSHVVYFISSLQYVLGVVLIGLFGYVLGNRIRR